MNDPNRMELTLPRLCVRTRIDTKDRTHIPVKATDLPEDLHEGHL